MRQWPNVSSSLLLYSPQERPQVWLEMICNRILCDCNVPQVFGVSYALVLQLPHYQSSELQAWSLEVKTVSSVMWPWYHQSGRQTLHTKGDMVRECNLYQHWRLSIPNKGRRLPKSHANNTCQNTSSSRATRMMKTATPASMAWSPFCDYK